MCLCCVPEIPHSFLHLPRLELALDTPWIRPRFALCWPHVALLLLLATDNPAWPCCASRLCSPKADIRLPWAARLLCLRLMETKASSNSEARPAVNVPSMGERSISNTRSVSITWRVSTCGASNAFAAQQILVPL
jgi:hypothetical protein